MRTSTGPAVRSSRPCAGTGGATSRWRQTCRYPLLHAAGRSVSAPVVYECPGAIAAAVGASGCLPRIRRGM